MANLKRDQQETISVVDAAKALTEISDKLSLFRDMTSFSTTFATNPVGFILQILDSLGISYEEIQEFLTRILIWVIPTIEISVKTVLLTNLKKMVSCSIEYQKNIERFIKNQRIITL